MHYDAAGAGEVPLEISSGLPLLAENSSKRLGEILEEAMAVVERRLLLRREPPAMAYSWLLLP